MRDTYYIIIVEENEMVYEKLIHALQKLGCNPDIRRVCTQEELDDELVSLAPDFVICDHSRSPWNSFAILEQVRAFQATMPFAVIGDGLDEEVHATLLARGVDACVADDRLGELVPTLHEMLKRRAEQQWQNVEEIRRNLPRLEPARRRVATRPQQVAAG